MIAWCMLPNSLSEKYSYSLNNSSLKRWPLDSSWQHLSLKLIYIPWSRSDQKGAPFISACVPQRRRFLVVGRPSASSLARRFISQSFLPPSLVSPPLAILPRYFGMVRCPHRWRRKNKRTKGENVAIHNSRPPLCAAVYYFLTDTT